MLVRDEKERDRSEVHALNLAAFDTPTEAVLVDRLRKEAQPVISMIALDGERVVGHIMFSPVTLSGHEDLRIAGLGPMAVEPTYQGKGLGSALVRAGLKRCKEQGYGAVVVLGHPEYYPRFGFAPAARFDICCEYEAPQEAFMSIELESGYFKDAEGTVRYHSAFPSA